MEESWKKTYNRIEDWHFWARARRELVVDYLKRKLALTPQRRILDIGCSAGNLLVALRDAGQQELYGIDNSPAAIALAREKGLQNINNTDGSSLAFPDSHFDVIVASDVLEHIESPVVALREWARILKPDGRLLVFVPAFEWLWTGHDDRNGHYRRYTTKSLSKELAEAGLQVEDSGFWNNALVIPAAILQLISKLMKKKLVEKGHSATYSPGIVNGLLVALLRLENFFLLRGVRIPFGLSTFAVAKIRS